MLPACFLTETRKRLGAFPHRFLIYYLFITLYTISISTGKSDVHIVFLFKNWVTQTSFLTCCNSMQHKLGKLFYKFFHLKLTFPGKALKFSNMKKDPRHPFLFVFTDLLKICVFKHASYGCYPRFSVSVPLLLSNSKSQVKFKKCTVHTVHP